MPSTLMLMVAGVLLAVSFWLPYWKMNLVTPAKPGGMRLVSYLHHLEGPLDSILAHRGKPGLDRLQDLRELELSLVVAMVVALCLLMVAALLCSRWTALLAVPALCFPLIVVADTTRLLVCIMATLSVAGRPLPDSPELFLYGRLAFGGVALESYPGAGMFLALASSITILGALWLDRSAYRAEKLKRREIRR